jgi:hypothetical protein
MFQALGSRIEIYPDKLRGEDMLCLLQWVPALPTAQPGCILEGQVTQAPRSWPDLGRRNLAI